MDFSVVAFKAEKRDGEWSVEPVEVTGVAGIRGIFAPYEARVTQVNVTRDEKVYYCLDFMEGKDTIEARVKSCDGEVHYMPSPLLFLQCRDDVPVDAENMFWKESVEFL